MIEEILSQEESKILEFKENASSPLKIIKTVIAFANTAGGHIVVGIEDESKKIVGVEHVLSEEERLSNLIFDLIEPVLISDIDIVSHSDKELLIINVPYLVGPFYLKKAGVDKGTYIRLGSSVRLADPETLINLQRLAKRISYDETLCRDATIQDLDRNFIEQKFKNFFTSISVKHYESLGLITTQNKKKLVTIGGMLLFGRNTSDFLPDSIIKCVAFSGKDRTNIIDKREIKENLINAVDDVIHFINRNTSVAADIGAVTRVDRPEYPIVAIREAVINAIVHCDYSIKGTSVQISIYSDRLEISNPGGLPFGQTMNSALGGISKMRNPILGRVFRELGLIETLGTGLHKITESYSGTSTRVPLIEEMDFNFKVTLYSRADKRIGREPWFSKLEEALLVSNEVSTRQMADIWNVTNRTARTRLNKLLKEEYLKRNSKSKNDPQSTYSKM